MTKKEIFDYIKHTPYNTNFNILDSMLNELVSGEGGNNFMTVNFTGEGVVSQESNLIEANNLEADKTIEEILAAYEAGTPVFGKYNFTTS